MTSETDESVERTAVVLTALVGFVVGFALTAVAGWVAVRAIEGDEAGAAAARGMARLEYRGYTDDRFVMPVLAAALAAGVGCAAVGGRAAVRAGASAALTRDERRVAVACCLWADLSGRDADYLRGLIVGRLAETDPAVAAKVAALPPGPMADLFDRVRRRQTM